MIGFEPLREKFITSMAWKTASASLPVSSKTRLNTSARVARSDAVDAWSNLFHIQGRVVLDRSFSPVVFAPAMARNCLAN